MSKRFFLVTTTVQHVLQAEDEAGAREKMRLKLLRFSKNNYDGGEMNSVKVEGVEDVTED